MSNTKHIFQTPVAKATPFDNSSNGFIADDVQEAIEELNQTIDLKAQYGAICGYNGTANATKWLEFFAAVSSNIAGFVLAEDSTLRSTSVSVQNNTTATFTLYVNGISTTTLSLSSARTNSLSNININLNANDEISVALTSGSAQNIIFNFYIRTEG